VYKLAGCKWTASLFQALGPQFAGGLLRTAGVPWCSQLFMGLGQPYLVEMLQVTGGLEVEVGWRWCHVRCCVLLGMSTG
jgi:hypothetical protein